MNLNFRAMAALCSVAVSLGTGCESADTQSLSGGISPLFTTGGDVGSLIQPYQPTEDDSAPAELADCTVVLAEDSVRISGGGAKVSGNTVVITNGGVYKLSGSGSQRIVLESSEDVSLILDGVEISSAAGAPIESRGSAQLKLSLAENSDNVLSSVSGSAGIASGGDIVVNGSGSLYVSAENCISSQGAVRLCGGELEFSCDKNGIVSSGYILCAGSMLGISSGAEGMIATEGYVSISGGSVDIVADGSGICASEAVFVSGGNTILRCGGGSSAVMFIESGGRYPYGRHGGFFTDGAREYDFGSLASGDGTAPAEKKGISSGGVVDLSGGTLAIDSADDSISAHGDVVINGGSITASTGDDAIRSKGRITVKSGSVDVSRSYTAIESLSVDILGGELRLSSYRDGIKAAGGNDIGFYSSDSDKSGHYVSISGGSVVIDAGGDGIDSGSTAALSGGEVTIFSTDDRRFGSIYYDDSFALSGGTLAAFGSEGLTRAPSMVSGLCLSVKAEIPAEAEVQLTDSSGEVLFRTVVPKACSTVVFSTEELVSGEEYSISADGEVLNTVTAAQGLSGDGPGGRGGSYEELHGSESTGGVVA